MFLSVIMYLLFLNLRRCLCLILTPDQRLPTLYCISEHNLAFEACFKLPATCTWTQAAKASLGRQRHTCEPRRTADT